MSESLWYAGSDGPVRFFHSHGANPAQSVKPGWHRAVIMMVIMMPGPADEQHRYEQSGGEGGAGGASVCGESEHSHHKPATRFWANPAAS